MPCLARWCGSRAAERFQDEKVSADQRLFLGPGPAFELGFALHGINERKRPFPIHETAPRVIARVLRPQTEAVFAQAFSQVMGLSDIVSAVSRLQDIDVRKAFDRFRTGYGRE